MKRTCVAVLAAVLAAPAGAQEPRPLPAKGPRISVEPASFDFGKALQNRTLNKEFSIRELIKQVPVGASDAVLNQTRYVSADLAPA